MAGIEKICEYSGDYPGGLMWNYKRNHIQICPRYRHHFKKTSHILIIAPSELQIVYPGGGTSTYNPSKDLDIIYAYDKKDYPIADKNWKGPGYYGLQWIRGYDYSMYKKINIKQEYVYDLYVPDRPGDVNGHYINWSYDVSTVKRKLKRMICKELNVVYVKDNQSIQQLRYCAEQLFTEYNTL